MTEVSRSRFIRSLRAEVYLWHQDNIISADQKATLLEKYPEPESNTASRFIGMAMNFGSVLVGLGSLLFVAANWDGMSAAIKLSLIFLSILLTNIAGWMLRFEPGNQPKLGTALLTIGSVLFGAGIWLVSQIFNFEIEIEQGLLLWGLGTAASAIVCESTILTIMATILLSCWNFFPESNILTLALSLGASILLSYKARSRWSLALALGLSACWTCFNHSLFGAENLGMYGTLMLAFYMLKWQPEKTFEKPFLYVGVCSTLISMLAFTFTHPNLQPEYSLKPVMLVLQTVIFFFCLKREKKVLPEHLAIFGTAILMLLFSLIPNDLPRICLANVAALAFIGGVIWAGTKRFSDQVLVNIALVFAVIDILLRYSDMFFSSMDRSLFFVGGGVILMLAASFAERSRRRLLRGA